MIDLKLERAIWEAICAGNLSMDDRVSVLLQVLRNNGFEIIRITDRDRIIEERDKFYQWYLNAEALRYGLAEREDAQR